MTAKTRRLRELLAAGEFLYMPSAATPLEGRLAEAAGTTLVYTGGYVSGASRVDQRAAFDDGRAGAHRRRGRARRRRCRCSPMPGRGSASRCTRCARCANSPPPGSPASISRTSSTRSGRIITAIRCTRSRSPNSSQDQMCLPSARRDRPRFRHHRPLRHVPRIRPRRGDPADQRSGRGRCRSGSCVPARPRRGRGGAAPVRRAARSGCRAAATATAGRSCR